MYFLTVLEGRNTKSVLARTTHPWKALREKPFHTPLLPFGGCWQPLVFLSLELPSNLCLSLHVAFFSVSLFSPLPVRALVTGFKAHPNSEWPPLN